MLPLKSTSSARLTGVGSARKSRIVRGLPAVEQLEVVLFEIGDRPALAVADDGAATATRPTLALKVGR